jgi:hypothetical protein
MEVRNQAVVPDSRGVEVGNHALVPDSQAAKVRNQDAVPHSDDAEQVSGRVGGGVEGGFLFADADICGRAALREVDDKRRDVAGRGRLEFEREKRAFAGEECGGETCVNRSTRRICGRFGRNCRKGGILALRNFSRGLI